MDNAINQQLAKIEYTAAKILQGKLSPARRDIETKKLSNLIYFLETDYEYNELRYLRNKLIGSKFALKQQLEEDGSLYLIIVETLTRTLNEFNYTKDNNFMAKFKKIYYYKIKEFISKQIQELNGKDNEQLKLQTIKTALNKLIDENYTKDSETRAKLKKFVANTTTVKPERIKDLLLHKILTIKQPDEERTIWDKFANKYIYAKYVVANEQINDEGENYYLSDKLANDNQNSAATENEQAILHFIAKIAENNPKIPNNDLKQYLNGLITILILKYELTYGNIPLSLKPYVNETVKTAYLELIKQQLNKDLSAIKPEIILAKYLQKKPDTVRKYPAKIKQLIANSELATLAKFK